MSKGILVTAVVLILTQIIGCQVTREIRVLSDDVTKANGVGDAYILVHGRDTTSEAHPCNWTQLIKTDKDGYASYMPPLNTSHITVLHKEGWVIDNYRTLIEDEGIKNRGSADNNKFNEFWIKRSTTEKPRQQLSHLINLSDELNLCRSVGENIEVVKQWDKMLYKEAIEVVRELNTSLNRRSMAISNTGIVANMLNALRNRRIKTVLHPFGIPDDVNFPAQSLERLAQLDIEINPQDALNIERTLMENDALTFIKVLEKTGPEKASKYFNQTKCSVLGTVIGVDGMPATRFNYNNKSTNNIRLPQTRSQLDGYINELSTQSSPPRLEDYSIKMSTALINRGYRLPDDYQDRSCDLREVSRIASSMTSKKDRPGIALLLNAGMSPNHSFNGPLLMSAMDRDENIALDLLKAGADINTRDGKRESLLARAIRSNKDKVVAYILSNGNATHALLEREYFILFRQAMLNQEIESHVMSRISTYNKSTLHKLFNAALNSNRKDVLQKLFEKGYVISTVSNNPLYGVVSEHNMLNAMYALNKSYDVELIDLLIKHGANVNGAGPGAGSTALMVAAEKRLYLPLDKLLSQGADPNILNNDGESALLLVSKNKEISSCSIQSEPGIYHAYSVASAELLKLNQNIVGAKKDGCNLIVLNHEIVKTLLEYNANPNVSTNLGRTPLMYFTQRGDIDSVKLLLKWGANKSAVDRFEKKASDYITTLRSSDLKKILE